METNTIPILETQEVTVFLTPIEANEFIMFRKYYPIIKVLIDNRVFDQKGATVSLHFDRVGTLTSVTRNDLLYHNKFDNVVNT